MDFLLDLATGTLRQVAAPEWSRLLPLPDGRFLCLCVTVTTSGEEEHYAVGIATVEFSLCVETPLLLSGLAMCTTAAKLP